MAIDIQRAYRTRSASAALRREHEIAPAASPSEPIWRRQIETVCVYLSFALLALMLLGVWLSLMQANRWT